MSINNIDDNIATTTMTEHLRRHNNNSYRLQRRRWTEEYTFTFKENCLFYETVAKQCKQQET